MSVRDVLKKEIERQPEPVLVEVLHDLRHVEAQRADEAANLTPNHGLVDLLLSCPSPFAVPPRGREDTAPVARCPAAVDPPAPA